MAGQKRRKISLEEGWAFVQKGITRFENILEGKDEKPFTSDEYILMFTAITNMCTQKEPDNHTAEIYHRYRDSFEKYYSSTVLPLLREKQGEFLLEEIVRRWSNHHTMDEWRASLFRHFDLNFCSLKPVASLHAVGLACFRELIIQGQIKDAVIALIDKNRDGEEVDKALLKNVLDIFVEIGSGKLDCYEKDFEEFFLKDTTEYYSVKAESWIPQYSCGDYLTKVEECLTLEKERVSHYLHISSELKLLENIKIAMLDQFVTPLLEGDSELSTWLCDNKVEDLSRMYKLFYTNIQGLKAISDFFKMHIVKEGNALVKQAEDALSNKPGKKDMVGKLEQADVSKMIELLKVYVSYVKDCFQGHTIFQKAIEGAFEVFCNKGVSGSSSAELLATFSDNILKKGHSDEATEDALDNAVMLLAYFSEKDLFAQFYKAKLSKRLLVNGSDVEQEERMLIKLKEQCGELFTKHMDTMLIDIAIAKDEQTEFELFLAEHQELKPEIPLSVTVLTSRFWPKYKISNINLPAEMVRCVEAYNSFYQTRAKHRKLTWIYSLGTCTISAKFDARPIDLIVPTYQAALLLLFNGADRLNYSEILAQLNLPDDDVKRLLYSLSCAKYNILNKEPANRFISPDDVFEFNSKFTHKMRKIQFSFTSFDSNETKKVAEDTVKDERKPTVEATIVRIMKTYKVMHHTRLIKQCVEQLSRIFKPDIKVIKACIEALIDREYLERDKNDANLYKYLA